MRKQKSAFYIHRNAVQLNCRLFDSLCISIGLSLSPFCTFFKKCSKLLSCVFSLVHLFRMRDCRFSDFQSESSAFQADCTL